MNLFDRQPAGKRCVATPGPRMELTVSRIDLVNIFEAGGGILSMEYGVHFPRYDLPAALVNSYPELIEQKIGKHAKAMLKDYEPTKATSALAPSIFYLFEDNKAKARLDSLFRECEQRRCPPDLLVRGIPATLVVRPLRYSCYCGDTPRRGAKLELLAIRFDPFSMGLPTYQDFLAEEEQDFEERAVEGGHDY